MLEIEYEFREEDLIHFNELRLSKSRGDGEKYQKAPADRARHHDVDRRFSIMSIISDRMSAGYVLLFALLWAIFVAKNHDLGYAPANID